MVAPFPTIFRKTVDEGIQTIAEASVCVPASIVTSANDSLVGNASPRYWRFAGRSNADGSVRARAGLPGAEAADSHPTRTHLNTHAHGVSCATARSTPHARACAFLAARTDIHAHAHVHVHVA